MMTKRHITALFTTVAPCAFASAPSMATTPETVKAAKSGFNPLEPDYYLRRGTDIAQMVDYWDKTDAIIDGIDGMRLAGERYLPKFVDEEEKDYNYRLKCTKFTNIYRDTVEGLASKPFEQEVTLAEDDNKPAPTDLVDFIENVDGSGNNLTVFASAVFFSGISSAIHWIFVDHPPADPTIRSRADAAARGVRPYWSHVLGRNVLEARSKVIDGIERLTYIRIFEPGKPDNVRVFERGDNGAVTWELLEKRNEWREVVGGRTQFYPVDGGALTIDQIPLVPFITGRRDGRTFKLFPAMQDAADLQIELYQQESGLKFAKQLTAYPMLAGNGVKPTRDASGTIQKLAVGPARVLYAPPDGSGASGSWAYVEPNAQSLKFLADDIKETISQLRELGRQPLTAQSGNLTVITTAVAAGKAKSAVGAWALGLKDALENAMVITCKWKAIDKAKYDPTVAVYTDFDEFAEGKDLEALAGARDARDLSQETYWDELKRRRVLSDEFDPDVERERLLKEVPGDGEDTSDDDDAPPASGPAPEDE